MYALLPVVVIDHVAETETSKLLSLTCIAFIISLSMILPAVLYRKFYNKEEDINYLKSTFSFFNVAFFGSPIVTALYGKEGLSLLFCVYLGTALYGDIIAYYQVARTKLSAKQALLKILKMPFIYTFIVAVFLKFIDFKTPDNIKPVFEILGWIVSATGMLIIGLSLKQLIPKKEQFKTTLKLLSYRILSAVMITGIILFSASIVLKNLEKPDYQILALLPLLPVSSNLSLFAAFLKTKEEQFAVTILVSILTSTLLISIATFFIK